MLPCPDENGLVTSGDRAYLQRMAIWPGPVNRPLDVSEDTIRERVHETERLAERRALEEEAERFRPRRRWWRRLRRAT